MPVLTLPNPDEFEEPSEEQGTVMPLPSFGLDAERTANAASRVDPDALSRHRQQGRVLGITPESVAADEPAAKALAREQEVAKALNEDESLFRVAPDPDRAALVTDDAPTLREVKEALHKRREDIERFEGQSALDRNIFTPGATAYQGIRKALSESGLKDSVERRALLEGDSELASSLEANEFFGPALEAIRRDQELSSVVSEGISSDIALDSADLREAAKMLELLPRDVEFEEAQQRGLGATVGALIEDPARVWRLGVEGLVTSAPALAAGILAGPLGAAGGSLYVESAAAMSEVLAKRNLDLASMSDEEIVAVLSDESLREEMGQAGIKKGVGVAMWDVIGAAAASKLLAPAAVAGKPLSRTQQEAVNLLAQMPLQGVTEAAGEATGSLFAFGEVDPVEVFLEGVAGGAMSSVDVGVFGGREALLRSRSAINQGRAMRRAKAQLDSFARDTESGLDAVEEAINLAQTALLKERDPQLLAEYVAEAKKGGVEQVYVAPEAVIAYVESTGENPAEVLERYNLSQTELEDAAFRGGYVEVPTEVLVTNDDGVQFLRAVREDAKVSYEGVTSRESEALKGLDDATFAASVSALSSPVTDDTGSAVYEDVFQQIMDTGRFTESQARAYATLWRSTMSSLAAKSGATADALYERFRPEITRGKNATRDARSALLIEQLRARADRRSLAEALETELSTVTEETSETTQRRETLARLQAEEARSVTAPGLTELDERLNALGVDVRERSTPEILGLLASEREGQEFEQQAFEPVAEAPEAFFELTGSERVVPVKSLVRTKTGERDSVINAARLMAEAAQGNVAKRPPIDVLDAGNGKYIVIDGNATSGVMLGSRWVETPVNVVGTVDDLLGPSRSEVEPEHQAKMTPEADEQLDAMYRLAAEGKLGFDRKLDKIANMVQGFALLAPLKGRKRTVEKLTTDYRDSKTGEVNVGRLKDVLRATIVVNDVDSASLAMTLIENVFGEAVIEGESRDTLTDVKAKLDGSGYRDVKYNIRVNGIVAELQVNTAANLLGKEIGHHLYDEVRKGTTTQERREQLEKAQRRLYGWSFEMSGFEGDPLNMADRAIERGNAISQAMNLGFTFDRSSIESHILESFRNASAIGYRDGGSSSTLNAVFNSLLRSTTTTGTPSLSTNNVGSTPSARPRGVRGLLAGIFSSFSQSGITYNTEDTTFSQAGHPGRVATRRPWGKAPVGDPLDVGTAVDMAVARSQPQLIRAFGAKLRAEYKIVTRRTVDQETGKVTTTTAWEGYPLAVATNAELEGAAEVARSRFEEAESALAQARAEDAEAQVPVREAQAALEEAKTRAQAEFFEPGVEPTAQQKTAVSRAVKKERDALAAARPAKAATRAAVAAAKGLLADMKAEHLRAQTLADEALIEGYIEVVTENLDWLYDQVPADIRARSKEWYVGANRFALSLAQRWGLTDKQVAGVIAALSPQKDWFDNATTAERTIDIWQERQDFAWTDEMNETAASIFAASKFTSRLNEIRGKSLREIEGNFEAGMWVRIWDQTYNSPAYRILAPEGDLQDYARRLDGVAKSLRWNSGAEVAKAIGILRDGSRENISNMLGTFHKVRNFYINILDPMSEAGEITIDTHAMAAAMLRPLSAQSQETVEGFSVPTNADTGLQGMYVIYAEAYRRAAERRGVLAREMQSITWEAVKGLFTPAFKTSSDAVRIDELWSEHHGEGKDLEETQAQVLRVAGGIEQPPWLARPAGTVDASARGTSYESRLPRARVPGRGADPGPVGDRSDLAPGVEEELSLAQAPVQDVEAFASDIKERFGLERFELAEDGGDLVLEWLVVPGELRKDGLGTKAMEALSAFADQGGRRVTLDLAVRDDDAGTTSRSRLAKFYKRFGFVENKGRNRDLETLAEMYREPQARTFAQAEPGELAQFLEDSKVPGVQYHGTRNDFDTFRSGGHDIGIHVGSAKAAEERIYGPGGRAAVPRATAAARQHLERSEAGANIMPLHVSIKNPLRVPDLGENWSFLRAWSRYTDELPGPVNELVKRGLEEGPGMVTVGTEINEQGERVDIFPSRDWLVDGLKALGYDGLVYRNLEEDAGSDSWVVFDPSQLKSALGNRGTFDPESQNIVEQQDRASFRISADRMERVISLFDGADASSFLHESAHFFLELVRDLDAAGQFDPKEADAIFTFLGVESWDGVGVQQHEMFAEGFEKYLFEGKAPTEELRSAFRKFADWLRSIYKAARSIGLTGVKLNDEARAMFDRLVAGEDAIDAELNKNEYLPAFEDAESAGMTEAEFERYRALAARSVEGARERVLARLMKDVTRRRTKERKARLKTFIKDAEQEIAQEPVWQALAYLRDRRSIAPGTESLGRLKVIRLDASSVSDAVGPEALTLLPTITVKRGGADVDGVAETFGFRSGVEMLQAILALGEVQADGKVTYRSLKAEAERRANVALDRDEGTSLDPARVQGEAQSALHDVDRAELLATELRILEDLFSSRAVRRSAEREVIDQGAGTAAGRRDEVAEAEAALQAATEGGDDAARQDAARLLEQARQRGDVARVQREADTVARRRTSEAMRARVQTFRAMARKYVQDMSMADLGRLNRLLVDERKAAREANAAIAAKDYAAASLAKQRHLWNHFVYAEAVKAKENSQVAMRLFKRWAKVKVPGNVQVANEYVNALQTLLAAHNAGPARIDPETARQQLPAVRGFIDTKNANGDQIVVPDSVYNARNLQTLSVAEVENLKGAVRSLVKWGRANSEEARQSFLEEMERLATHIESNVGQRKDREELGRIRRGTRDFADHVMLSHRKAEHLMNELDGFEELGPMWRTVFDPINEAANTEADMRAKAAVELKAVWQALQNLTSHQRTKKHYIAGLRLTREEMIAVGLNWGNEGNREALLNGSRDWTEEQLETVVNQLTDAEWNFIEQVWDFIDGYWPAISELESRMTGVSPEKVEGEVFETSSGRLVRGNYYPIKFDPKASAPANIDAVQDQARQLMSGDYSRAATRHGFTKERVGSRESGKRVHLSLDVMFRHVDDVIHDLSHREAVLGVHKVLNSREVSRAMANRYGAEVGRYLNRWLKNVAAGSVVPVDFNEIVFRHLRVGLSVAEMGLSLRTALVQPLGMTQTVARIGPVYALKGIASFVGSNYGNVFARVQWVNEKSPAMTERGKVFDRDIAAASRRLNPGNKLDRLKDAAFWLISKLDMMVSYSSWIGAYDKSMAEGKTEAEAVKFADHVVRTSQGSGLAKDLADIQAGSEGKRLLTSFYTFFGAYHNMTLDALKRTGKIANQDGVLYATAYAANQFLWLVALPSIVAAAALDGGPDEDNDEEWWEWATKVMVGFGLSGMVLVRDAAMAMTSDFGYDGPPTFRALKEATNFATQVQQGEIDKALVRSGLMATGYLGQLPTRQVWRSIEALWDYTEGEATAPEAIAGATGLRHFKE